MIVRSHQATTDHAHGSGIAHRRAVVRVHGAGVTSAAPSGRGRRSARRGDAPPARRRRASCERHRPGGSAVSAGVWTGTNPSERGWFPPSDTRLTTRGPRLDEDPAVRAVGHRDAELGVDGSLVRGVRIAEHCDHVAQRRDDGLDLIPRQPRRGSSVSEQPLGTDALGADLGDPPADERGAVAVQLAVAVGDLAFAAWTLASSTEPRPSAAASASHVSSRCSGSKTVASQRSRPGRIASSRTFTDRS